MANAPYLFGPFDPNPVLVTSGLAEHVSSGVLGGQATIDPNYGWQAQALGHRAILEWIHGQVPWWNPFEGVGMPLAGNMQSASMFPLVPLMLLPNGVFLSHLVLEVATGAATCALLRRLGVGTAAAVGCGSAFALDGTFSWFAIAPVNVIVSLPLALLGVEQARSAAASRRRGGWALLAVAVAVSVYAGFPETAFIDGILVLVWLLARFGGLSWRTIRSLALKAALGALSGVLMAAPLLVAFADDSRGAYLGIHSASLDRLALPASGSVQVAFPYFLGPIFGFDANGALTAVWGNVGGYLDTSLIVLAVMGLVGAVRGPYRGLRAVLGLWVLVALARTYGAGWAMAVVGAIPGMDRVAFYRYSPVSVEMAVVVLAALGIQDLAAAGWRSRLVTAGAALAAAAVAAAALVGLGDRAIRHIASAPHAGLWREASTAWGFALLVAVALAALLPRRARPAAIACLVAVDAVALFVVPQLSAPRGGRVDTAALAYLRSNLGEQRVYAMGLVLQPNYGSYYGVAEADYDELPVPRPWVTYATTRLDTGASPITFDGTVRASAGSPSATQELLAHLGAFRAAGVAYVAVPAGQALPAPLARVWSDRLMWIYRLAGAAPLFSTVGAPPGCSVSSATVDTARVTCGRPATLVRRELYEPGWHATSGGRSLPVSAYDTAFQAVRVPAGTTSVRYYFEPPHIGEAWAADALGLLMLAAVLAVQVATRMGMEDKSWKRSSRPSRYAPRHAGPPG